MLQSRHSDCKHSVEGSADSRNLSTITIYKSARGLRSYGSVVPDVGRQQGCGSSREGSCVEERQLLRGERAQVAITASRAVLRAAVHEVLIRRSAFGTVGAPKSAVQTRKSSPPSQHLWAGATQLLAIGAIVRRAHRHNVMALRLGPRRRQLSSYSEQLAPIPTDQFQLSPQESVAEDPVSDPRRPSGD